MEQFGIRKYGLEGNCFATSPTTSKLSPTLKYLASEMGLSSPITPVATTAEKKLFVQLTDGMGSRFNLSKLSEQFNSNANGQDISPKLPFQLQMYKDAWNKSNNIRISISPHRIENKRFRSEMESLPKRMFTLVLLVLFPKRCHPSYCLVFVSFSIVATVKVIHVPAEVKGLRVTLTFNSLFYSFEHSLFLFLLFLSSFSSLFFFLSFSPFSSFIFSSWRPHIP